ncbi:hypothetical protein FS749_007609 [Ceratobasidium sp. UAMH 11750]|nr:hypothetical protein FS749_007609 [Ceratobasidium sp. UAMH 11750]
MQSTTSPPPFMQYYSGQRNSILDQPIQPRAEHRVEDTPIENPTPKAGRNVHLGSQMTSFSVNSDVVSARGASSNRDGPQSCVLGSRTVG